MKKILVTGAAGFVGTHLVPMLLKEGFYVGVLDKKKTLNSFKNKNIKIIIDDLSEKGEWVKKINVFDVIIHLAAQISSKEVEDFERNNVTATENLIKFINRKKIKKIIVFSSAAVNSIRKDPYAETKMEQENIVKKSGINYAALRPSMIYGPGDTKNMGWLISFIKKYPVVPLPGGGNFGRQPIFVEDICQIVLKLINRSTKDTIYEIHGFEYVTMKRMINVILRNLELRKMVVYIPIFLLKFIFWLGQILTPNPKFTVDQIESLTLGEKFKSDKWWDIFNIKVTRFEDGIVRMIKK